MTDFIILIGLTTYVDLGDDADRDRGKRLWDISDLVFSFGPAWMGNQSSILLKSALSRDEIVDRIAPLVSHSDLVGLIEITTNSVTMIGYTADEEGLDALYPNVRRV